MTATTSAGQGDMLQEGGGGAAAVLPHICAGVGVGGEVGQWRVEYLQVE